MVLTKTEQYLLLEMLLKKKIRKEDQKIIMTSRFYNTMSKLKDFGLVDCKTNRNKKSGKYGKNYYFLTFKGYCRANMISYDHNVEDKYFKASRELTIIP